jgi:hypothetical protein
MSQIIRCSIAVNKIDKKRLKKHENGNTYYSFTLLERREVGQYGDTHMVVEDITKEERQSGVKGTILGKGEEVQPKGEAAPPKPVAAGGATEEEDIIPF